MYPRIPEIMSFKQCQAFLQVGKNTLLNLLHDNEIAAFKIGSRWKIQRESVEEFVRYR